MLSIFVMAASRCAPRVRAEGSLKLPPSVVVAPAGAGDGVAGASDVVVEAGAGAAGGAGVCDVAGAGVDGAADEVDVELAAGAAFGYECCQRRLQGYEL